MSESETPAAPLSPQEASAATPAAELERQIMYSGEPKNEREWWAAREIERLRARNEAHVAALQEIGRGVEADQATIARLREELAQADAVIAETYGHVAVDFLAPRIAEAIERHRARHDTEGR